MLTVQELFDQAVNQYVLAQPEAGQAHLPPPEFDRLVGRVATRYFITPAEATQYVLNALDNRFSSKSREEI